jgi:hypothetical protein
MRLHVVCEQPRVVATFVAAPFGGKVLSYEHYWHDAQTFSSELDRRDDAILATLRAKTVATTCPSTVLARGTRRERHSSAIANRPDARAPEA